MENFDEVDQSQVRERLKMRIGVLEECVKSFELECKSGSETTVRLTAELDRERRKVASSSAAFDSLKLELHDLVAGRRDMEMEKETLLERVEASKRVIEAGRRESLCLEKQVKELERRLQQSHGETRAAEERLQAFLGKVASLLQVKSETVVVPAERDVLHVVENLCNERLSNMEARLARVSEQLSEQTELHHSAAQRAELAEQQVHDLRQRLHMAETELLTAHVQRDGLRQSKEHYEGFVEQLSERMNIENIAADLSFDMTLKLIQSRVQQLIQQEAAALVESRHLTSSLQRKLKSQKDQLESKGLHVQLLRKKVSELEEEKKRHSGEEDNAHREVKKLQKRLERLQNELRATKVSNTELKAQMSHTNELKVKGHRTQSEHAGAEEEAGSAGAGEGRGGEQTEHSQLRPEEPGEEEQRGAPEPQTEPGPADRGSRAEGNFERFH